MTGDAIKQQRLEGARRFKNELINRLNKLDDGNARSKFKSAIREIQYIANNLDMDAAAQGYVFMTNRKNEGYIRGLLTGLVLASVVFIYGIGWGWL